MLKKPARTFVIAAVVLCVVALVQVWPERPAQVDAVPPPSSLGPPAPLSGGPPVAALAAPALPPASVAPVRLRLQAPSDVHAGQAFQAQIVLEADRGVRELFFTVTFATSRLALTGWAEGDFAQQAGVPAETNAEEPSDGNVQVAFRVSNGLSIAGTGTLVALQLEAIRAGTSGITLSDVTAFGSDGAPEPAIAILEAGVVTIR
jgi:hypothetical protein